jgi:hypothetical protein
MKRSRFTEEQIIGILREQEAGATADRPSNPSQLIRTPIAPPALLRQSPERTLTSAG